MSLETSDSNTEHINEYEKLRMLRIAENQAKLQSLGLRGTVKSLSKRFAANGRHSFTVASKAVIKARVTCRATAPCTQRRRSARIRGKPAPAQQPQKHDVLGQKQPEGTPIDVNRLPPLGVHGSHRDSFAKLNQHRISTMSEDALRNRINKIRNVPKMRSFIEELRERQLLHLASEAEVALIPLIGMSNDG